MKKFAIILAGCGVYDGAEIHEAVLTMLAISKNGAEYEIFAPDIMQHHVVDHITGNVMPETRNVLTEAARIARGKIKPLDQLNPEQFDAVILPGGFGVAKNLCTFAFDGPDCTVNPDLEKILVETHLKGKPIGAMCISPVIISRIFKNSKVTIGQDAGTAQAVKKMGANHIITGHGEVVVDTSNKIFTTPCYMLDANILQIAEGTDNLVKEMLKMM